MTTTCSEKKPDSYHHGDLRNTLIIAAAELIRESGSADFAMVDAARRAVASDPTSQDAHRALAAVHFCRHEVDAFFVEAERAIALNPNHAFTLAYMGLKFEHVGDERGIVLVPI